MQEELNGQKGKWSNWFNNIGNKDANKPKDYSGSLDCICEVVFYSGCRPSDTHINTLRWDVSIDKLPDPGDIVQYRYWIPETEYTTEDVQEDTRKHNHYFKDVSHLDYIDVYRIIDLYKIQDPCLQHALKKVLVAGGRGSKDTNKDIQEVIDSCLRYQEMQKENEKGN
jgi:hypothetical protein